jgi:DNA primase
MSPGYEYLFFKRNFSPATIIEMQYGYCPDWRILTHDVTASGRFSVAEKLGVVKRANGDITTYDFFHHRITIPIEDALGRLIGFGGRLLPGTEGPKYLNPQASPVYDKSRVIYGLNKAKTQFRKHGGACLVEGYFDVGKLRQAGWTNAIATCGTALTHEQAMQIKKHTDTVLVMRDGDNAGYKATEKDVRILTAVQLIVQVVTLPAGEDPDTLFDQPQLAKWWNCLSGIQDGIEWLASKYVKDGSHSTSAMATAIDNIVELLAMISNQVRREEYMKAIARTHKLRVMDISKPLDRYFKDQRESEQAKTQDDGPELPSWFSQDKYYQDGFVQNPENTKTHKVGVYVMGEKGPMRVTNFVIEPLYQILESSNPRRLVQVHNGYKSAVIELPNTAFVTQSVFQTELLNRGNFNLEYTFQKKNFMQMSSWLNHHERMPIAYELKTLGWQPEGFFSFSNALVHKAELLEYDDLGMVSIEGRNFLSLGNSKIHVDERITDNQYENDLYLKYVKSPISFSKWAELFNTCYDTNAPFGIAFVMITLFKDLVTKVAKMPMLYCFGPKGSGKSAMAESLTWLFFSGKSPEGHLIKGFNLNPGQGSPFSFFNRLGRFRNCPVLMNEFDEDIIEPFKFGAFKAAYDGEGREMGTGDSGKKRKTEIQKVQGTIIIVGQYLSTKDDGSVLSRSISCQFSLERIRDMSQHQIDTYKELERFENEGLSSIIVELMAFRNDVQKNLAKYFGEVQTQMMTETRAEGHRVEARLISNYCLFLSMIRTMESAGLQLPFSYDSFYVTCKKKIVEHNRVLKDNNALQQFWKGIESLFDSGILKTADIKICPEYEISIKGEQQKKRFAGSKRILYMRFTNVYNVYAENYRKRTGKSAQAEETYLLYLKEQSYFIGLCPAVSFDNKRTSGYAFDYDALLSLGVVLERNGESTERSDETPPPPVKDEDLPF